MVLEYYDLRVMELLFTELFEIYPMTSCNGHLGSYIITEQKGLLLSVTVSREQLVSRGNKSCYFSRMLEMETDRQTTTKNRLQFVDDMKKIFRNSLSSRIFFVNYTFLPLHFVGNGSTVRKNSVTYQKSAGLKSSVLFNFSQSYRASWYYQSFYSNWYTSF
jgi:hypothetical protein